LTKYNLYVILIIESGVIKMRATQLVMPWADVNLIKGGPGFRFILTLLSSNVLMIIRDRMVFQGESKEVISEVDAEVERRIK